MNTTDLIKKKLYNLLFWNDKTKAEIETDKERFIWFTHHINDNYDILDTSYGNIKYNERYKDYIAVKEDHLLPTDTIINSNTKKFKDDFEELKSYGLINITPIKNENNKIAYFVDMDQDPLTAGFVIYHNENIYHYYPKIKFKQDGEETFIHLIPRNFNNENFIPYIYKKGYADIAVSKEGYNIGMTLQGYILGYKIKDVAHNLEINFSCSIPNSDTDIFPTFEISILPYDKDITDIKIYLGTDHPHIKYKDITVPRLVKGAKREFNMIAEKFDRFGTNKDQDIKINSYLARFDRDHRDIIVFTKNGIDYSINPTITINSERRYIIPEIIDNISNILYENLRFSSENKFIGNYYSIATSQKILNNDWSIKDSIIVYLAINIVNDELKFKIQIQNPWFMDNEVHITISPKTWVEEKGRHISEFFNSDDIHLTLEPGKKATIESN